MNPRPFWLGALGMVLAVTRPAQALSPADGAPPPAPEPAPASPPWAASPAWPSDPPATITVSGNCPNAEALWTAVQSIVPAKDVDKLSSSAKVTVSDLGDTYRVAVSAKGQRIDRLRVYRDLARDCDHRARFAAVFVVLTLMPPDVLIDALPSPEPAPPPPPPPVIEPPPPRPPKPILAAPPPRRVRLELAAFGDLAPALWSAAATSALGGELRVALRARRLTITGAIGYAPRLTFDLGGLTASEKRAPFDLGLRLGLATFRAVDLAADLGVAGALFRASGTDTVDPESGTRLDLGARAGVVLRFGGAKTRLAPILGLHADVFPKPYQITALPQGTLGRTPALWFGATAGIAVRP